MPPMYFRSVIAIALSFGSNIFAAERHVLTDDGPFYSATIEAHWPRNNITYKGIAIRLGDNKAGILYDTDLMRVAAGWISSDGNYLNHAADIMQSRDHRATLINGKQIFATNPYPGWADTLRPERGEGFDDPRSKESPFGPLPKRWAKYRGLYVHGDNVVMSYTVGNREVLESPAIESVNGIDLITRSFNLGKSGSRHRLNVCERSGSIGSIMSNGRIAVLRRRPSSAPGQPPDRAIVDVDRNAHNPSWLAMGAPSKNDFADASSANRVTMWYVEGYASPTTASGAKGRMLARLNDGKPARGVDDNDRAVSFSGEAARWIVDLKTSVEVKHVDTFSWGSSEDAIQQYDLYGSDSIKMPSTGARDPVAGGWDKIAHVDTKAQGAGGAHGVKIHRGEPHILGRYRRLMFVSNNPKSRFSEIDIFTKDGKPKFTNPRLEPNEITAVALVGGPSGAALHIANRTRVRLTVPRTSSDSRIKLVMWTGPASDLAKFQGALTRIASARDLKALTKGGPMRWKKTIATKGNLGKRGKAYEVDTLKLPDDNPWNAWMRPGGFDFFADGKHAALCNINGDVWIVSGIDAGLQNLKWQRVATGLFHPLGLEIVDQQIHILGRDQITRLHDLNGDGEIDFYENFHNEMHVTSNFHEFATGLQTDATGNFYFAKAAPVRNGGRGFDRIAKHHGSVMRLSKDAQKLDVIATGLRAANGIGVRADGQITTGDNEGSWMPRCRLNWVKPGGFYGVPPVAHQRSSPTKYDPPLCWFPKEVDNSSGGQVWVTSNKWGSLEDHLLHLSYGTSSLFHVLMEEVDGVMQGGVVRFPLTFESGIMRAAFNPVDGQLYVCGLKGWQTNGVRDGCFQRVRFTGKPFTIPTGMNVHSNGIRITFNNPVDRKDAADPQVWAIEQWNYVWSHQYGSPEVSALNPDQKVLDRAKTTEMHDYRKHDKLAIKRVQVSRDGRSVFIELSDVRAVMQMKISFDMVDARGDDVVYQIHNTINRVGRRFRGF